MSTAMTPHMESRILVIGVGNTYRGDDAVGLIVVERLKNQPALNHVMLLERTGSLAGGSSLAVDHGSEDDLRQTENSISASMSPFVAQCKASAFAHSSTGWQRTWG